MLMSPFHGVNALEQPDVGRRSLKIVGANITLLRGERYEDIYDSSHLSGFDLDLDSHGNWSPDTGRANAGGGNLL